MDAELERFREEAKGLREQRTRGAAPFSAEQKRFAIAYAKRRRRTGARLGTIARELTVTAMTLRSWLEPASSARLERVHVVQEQSAVERAKLVVHGPRSLRIEGLGLEEIAELWTRFS